MRSIHQQERSNATTPPTMPPIRAALSGVLRDGRSWRLQLATTVALFADSNQNHETFILYL
jgi:hypothetical protein